MIRALVCLAIVLASCGAPCRDRGACYTRPASLDAGTESEADLAELSPENAE